MNNYQRINTRKPEGIENKRAFLIGSGIASLAAAEYLMRDGHMQGNQITIFEEGSLAGGAMDGAGNPEDGFIARGGREMEAHYECLWDLLSQVPSIEEEERTVLDEFRELNEIDPNFSKVRVIYNRGEKHRRTDLGLHEKNTHKLTRLLLTKEEDLGAATVEEYFDKSFFETDMWLYWRSMFAFETWHSVVEMKRYMHRFIHLMPGMSTMRGLVFTKYNQYDSLILPLKRLLESKGVSFVFNTTVTDLDIDINEDQKTVTAIHLNKNGSEETIKTSADDLVFFTNGSMTENSSLGDTDHAPVLDRSEGAVWGLWKKVAAKDEAFGKPEVFCSDIDKTKWESFTITAKGTKIRKLLEDFAERKFLPHRTATGGIITVKDSSWLLSVTVNRQPQFKNQPADTTVAWAYALFPDKKGDFIDKKMSECTGRELLQELLYHLGIDANEMQAYLDECIVIPAMMPYITSQFMPRVKGDRPKVIPEGSVNLAFLGQFCEIEGDCVFTVEYSVRSAIMAVYHFLNLEKPVPEIYPSQYDIRALAAAVKTMKPDDEGIVQRLIESVIKKKLANTTFEGLL
ncbi:oleate hydratase [Sulfurovum sp. NBC37-1]|uniref:oleate hydratase n=1 Tax=Sulfurovum sp. (strain NBC37-1) TaxID=387093 RepID=UPI000158748F|nr:oleate hydratase [Sulfurovum sp. NBC37-1]BAF72079.1 myosin-crossreactive antigen [Sulfurovum sp. NBC37-1]